MFIVAVHRFTQERAPVPEGVAVHRNRFVEKNYAENEASLKDGKHTTIILRNHLRGAGLDNIFNHDSKRVDAKKGRRIWQRRYPLLGWSA